jgi:DNA repair protein RecO (recombination protein O)
MNYLQTQALVLKTWPLKEYDLIVALLSPELGKIRAVVKGVKRSTAKFRGYFEMPYHLNVQLYSSRSELKTISQTESLNPFLEIKKDIKKLFKAFVILEACLYGSSEGSESKPVFDLAIGVLNYLNQTATDNFVLGAFALKLLKAEGLTPEIKQCIYCQNPEIQAISVSEFATVCKNCAPANAKFFSKNTLTLFRLVLSNQINLAFSFAEKIPQNELKLSEELALDMLEHHFEHRLNSRAMATSI